MPFVISYQQEITSYNGAFYFTLKENIVPRKAKKDIFYETRGPCPLLALLVNPRSQGLRPLQPVFAKSHLFLANIKQILMHFIYMRDQEKN